MEVNNNINSSISTINHNDSSQIQTNNVQLNEQDKSSSVNINFDASSLLKRSNLSQEIASSVKEISSVDSLSSMLQNQAALIDNIDSSISSFLDGSSTQNETQPTVAEFISKYNSNITPINEIVAKLEDLEGDSITYFDGKAGAIPLNVDLIDTESDNKRVELAKTLVSISELNTMYEDKAKGVIGKEAQSSTEASPFKAMDFGKESADFSSSNISAISGSIVVSQANASQVQATKLLA